MSDLVASRELPAALTRLQPGWVPARVIDCTPMPAGLSNANVAFTYEAKRYVLRLARDGVGGAIERRVEYGLLCNRVAGLTAPLVAYCLPEGHLLTRYVEGSLLVDVAPDLSAIASYLAALHARLRPFGWAHPLPALVERWLASARTAGADIPAPWTAALARMPATEPSGPSHNDLNPWNVIVRGSAPRDWCTLDWEWCGDHSPHFDVVTLCEGLDLTGEETREVVDRYCRLRDVPCPDDAHLEDVRLRFHLREGAWAFAAQARFGDRPELAHQIARSRERLAALIG